MRTWRERAQEALAPILGEGMTKALLDEVERNTLKNGALDMIYVVPEDKTKQVQETLAKIWPDEGSYGVTIHNPYNDPNPRYIHILRRPREHNPIRKRRSRK
jgi:hypothetical protein